MYEKPRVNVKVEPRSTFTFTSDLPYIVSILFTHVKPVKVYVRTHVKITRQWKSTLHVHTIMDKSLGTNIHLWCFFTRAKQIHLHLFNPSPSPPPTMLDTCTRYFSRVSTLYWGVGGMQRILKRITVLF